jgi:hypothetical protein
VRGGIRIADCGIDRSRKVAAAFRLRKETQAKACGYINLFLDKAMKNILTVGVEDWYHICDIEHVLPPSSWDRCESRILFNMEKILTLFGRFKVKEVLFG